MTPVRGTVRLRAGLDLIGADEAAALGYVITWCIAMGVIAWVIGAL